MLSIGVGLLIWTATGLTLWLMFASTRGERLLRERGVSGAATVIRKFRTPEIQTPRIEYRLDVAPATREVAVKTTFWDALKVGDQVPVQYVPGEPSISRLEIGEVSDDNRFIRSAVARTMAGVGGAVIGGMFVIAGLAERRKTRPRG